MTQLPSNIVKKRIFVQETVKVYEESKWTIYAWWLVQGTVAGAFGAVTFSPQLASPWWLLTAYLLAVFAIKRASMTLAQHCFYRMGDYDLAIADCDATLSAKTMICTVWTMALVVRGKCYAAKDEHKLAKSDFDAVFNDTTDATLLKEAAAGLHALPPIEDADDAE